jgi:hypothetical protein
MNMNSAGNAIQVTEPLRPPLELADFVTRAAGGASVVICR